MYQSSMLLPASLYDKNTVPGPYLSGWFAFSFNGWEALSVILEVSDEDDAMSLVMIPQGWEDDWLAFQQQFVTSSIGSCTEYVGSVLTSLALHKRAEVPSKRKSSSQHLIRSFCQQRSLRRFLVSALSSRKKYSHAMKHCGCLVCARFCLLGLLALARQHSSRQLQQSIS